jgi:hypothetical protein
VGILVILSTANKGGENINNQKSVILVIIAICNYRVYESNSEVSKISKTEVKQVAAANRINGSGES